MEISENFSYIGPNQNFDRDSYATIAEMKAVQDKHMPNIFLATCEETGKAYIYRKANSVDATLGKWRDAAIDESASKLTAEQISHLLYQLATLPTTSTADFPIVNGTRIYNSTDKKIYVATVAQDGTVTWEAETSVNSGNNSGSGDSGNSGSDSITVANPVISITDGSVTITCTTTGATIYYTTDGTAPTTDSAAYTGAFTVEDGTTVKAVAVKDGTFSSTVSKEYTASSSNPDPNPDDPTDPDDSVNSDDSTDPDDPVNSDDSVVEKDYAYYGFLSGTLETTEKITDEGIDVSETSVKTLTKVEATSKNRTCTYVATQAEEDAEGQSFMIYAYPAKFGELTRYNFGMGYNDIGNTFTKFEFAIDGVNYYVYAQTEGSAPDVGSTSNYTFE